MERRGRFWATALMGLMILMIVIPIFAALADEGFFKEVWVDVIEAFPFGSSFGELAIRIFNKIVMTGASMVEYEQAFTKLTGPAALMQEFGKLCLTAVIYEAVANAGDAAMVTKETSKGWAFAQRTLWHMLAALLCAGLCSMLLRFTYGQINQLLPKLSGLWSGIIAGIVLSGAVGVFFFVLGIGLLRTLLFVFVKIVLMNVLNLCTSYLFLLFVLLCMSEKAYVKIASGSCIWLAVIVALIGIDLMLTPVLKKK